MAMNVPALLSFCSAYFSIAALASRAVIVRSC
jgi:hypothetical protein